MPHRRRPHLIACALGALLAASLLVPAPRMPGPPQLGSLPGLRVLTGRAGRRLLIY